MVQGIGDDHADETRTEGPTVSSQRQLPNECVGQLALPVSRGARHQVLQPASGPSRADPSSFIKEVVRCGSPGPVHEPWTALFATLTVPARPSQVKWPDSLRHIVRCLGGVDENGTEQAPRFETGPRVDVDTLVLDASQPRANDAGTVGQGNRSQSEAAGRPVGALATRRARSSGRRWGVGVNGAQRRGAQRQVGVERDPARAEHDLVNLLLPLASRRERGAIGRRRTAREHQVALHTALMLGARE